MPEDFGLNKQFEGLFNTPSLVRCIYEQLASKLGNQESFVITIGDKARFVVKKDPDPDGSDGNIHIHDLEKGYIYLVWPDGAAAKVSKADPEKPLELEKGELETILNSFGSLTDQGKAA